ncbi:baculoviral IAP repeat-containing protein 7-A-like [Procambarus clarkii]|uniref:baculoviral IAP repeat-containing protein 7-A-like n=1 Tax=Procambarus clarkii TaxID=6728 RepID=UPI003744898D
MAGTSSGECQYKLSYVGIVKTVYIREAVCELLQPDNQHIVNLSHLDKHQLNVICFTPLYNEYEETSLLALPPHYTLNLFTALGFISPAYSIIEAKDVVKHQNKNVRRSISKKFDSYDSLRFEKERLDTYIDWPLEWLEPSDLARDGFYYLRTNDHVACVFCRGILGSWERGDTPRGEHQFHFPHCQFIRNQPVGNFPLIFNEKFEGYSVPLRNSKNSSYRQGIDVCGLSPMTDNGVHQHTIAKRKDYLTLESRLASFNHWPERVTQKPTELSEAGFFYCGLSDHVRCYHCGNGLRNWETDDIPWDEHARWYPECTFLFLMKGKEFIDQVQGERPPYETNPSITHINEDQHKLIKELDITKHLISMGFQEDYVMTTYHNQLKEKGLPFFDIESFIEAVLQYMENEVRKCLVNKLALAEVDVVPSPAISDRNELASDTNQQVESSTTLMELVV